MNTEIENEKEAKNEIETYTDEQIRSLLVHPASDANKYTRGKLVVVAGSSAYPGAACLTSFAAQRMGAGYVEVVCAPESANVVRASRASLVVRSWDGWRFADSAELAAQHADSADSEKYCADHPADSEQHHTDHPAACVIGPGFDAHGKVEKKLVLAALREVATPLLIDGGAISVLATSEGIAAAHERAERGWSLVVTPHGGEAARMEYAARIKTDANAADYAQVDAQAAATGTPTQPETPASTPVQAPAQANRAQALASAYHCVVALKGSDTYLSDGKRRVAMLQGTAALAKAGTGDVLAGMIGALLAQNVDPLDACVVGTTVHAKAGCDAADRLGDISVTAEDVIASIPSVIYDLSFPNRIL